MLPTDGHKIQKSAHKYFWYILIRRVGEKDGRKGREEGKGAKERMRER